MSTVDPELEVNVTDVSSEEQALSLVARHGVTFGDEFAIPHDQIRVMPGQPREEFDPDRMNSLIHSMQILEQLHAGMVRKLDVDELAALPPGSRVKWELVDGERRHRACTKLELPFKAKEVFNLTPDLQFLLSVALNFNREDHNPLEIAKAAQRLKQTHSDEETSKIIGKSIPSIYSYLKLLQLHPDLQARLTSPTPKKQRMRIGVGKELARLVKEQQLIAWSLIKGNPTLKAAQNAVAGLLEEKPDAIAPGNTPRRLDSHGAMISIKRTLKRVKDMNDSLSGRTIAEFPREKRQEIHESLETLREEFAMLQQELAHDFEPPTED